MTDHNKIIGVILRTICCVMLAAMALFGCGKSVSDKADEAFEQGNQAAILYNQQEYTKALSAISQVITVNSELKRDSALGENYLLLALCHRKLGQYDSSISSFKLSLEYFHLVGDQRLERRGRIALAELFYALGQFKDAQSLASDAAGEAKVFSDVPNMTHALLLVAKASRRLQDFSRDAAALDELSKIKGKEVAHAQFLKLRFQAALAARDGEHAREAFEQWKSSLNESGDSVGVAETYAAWGHYQLSLGRLDSAQQAYSQALNMVGGLSSRRLQEEVLSALGIIAYRSARYDNARLYFQEAQSLARQENNILYEQLLNLIVVACDWKNGRASQTFATDLTKRCADIGSTCRQSGFRVGTMFALYIKGSIEYRATDTASARASFTEAFHLDMQNISPNTEAYPVFDIINTFLEGERSTWTDPLLQMCMAAQRYGDCVTLAEQINLRDMQRFFGLSTLTTGDVHVNHAASELRLKRNALKLLEEDIYEELSLGNSRNLERVNLLNKLYPERLQELSNAEKTLDGTNLQWLVCPKPITMKAIRDTLPQNSTLVEFVPLSNELHLLVLTRDSIYVRTSPITRIRLLALIDEYNHLIGDPRLNGHVPNFNEVTAAARVQELSSILCNVLIDPVYALIDKSTKVYVVLPPEFGWLPIHTLRSSGGVPMIARVPISYLPTAAALLFQSKNEKFVSEVVALGHAGKSNWDVEYELKDIRSFYDKVKMFFDTTATLDHLKPLSYDIVHVAAEFGLDTEVPENSAIVLSDGITPFGLAPVSLGNMLTFSYPPTFVFSNISPTAGGLSRYAPMLFLAGGSRTLITTMWQGERKAKKYFGEVFYTNLMAGVSASTAYQQAMIAMINNAEFSRLHRWGLYYQFGR